VEENAGEGKGIEKTPCEGKPRKPLNDQIGGKRETWWGVVEKSQRMLKPEHW